MFCDALRGDLMAARRPVNIEPIVQSLGIASRRPYQIRSEIQAIETQFIEVITKTAIQRDLRVDISVDSQMAPSRQIVPVDAVTERKIHY
jgi:hypothetical protein